MFADLRFAFRLLFKNPGFAVVTLVTLALCIGANTAIFSAVYALMLKPLPYPEPERIVELFNTYPKAGGAAGRGASNPVQYNDYGQNATSYESVALVNAGPRMVGEDAASQRLWGMSATSEIFAVLGLKPLIGQFYTKENQLPAASKVVVLTQSYWEAQYQEDPAVLGKTARIDSETYTIVGIAPRAFEAFDARVRYIIPAAWDPASINPNSRHGNGPKLFARLKPGVSVAQALAEANTIERRFYDAAPPPLRQFLDRSGHQIVVAGVQAERVAPMRDNLWLLQAGVVAVLLIGCVNVANLLLARANSRQAELAIRFALGATRGTVARQLLLESLLLTALGTAAGLAVAWGAVQAMNLYREEMMPSALPFVLDGQVLGLTIAISAGVGLLIGALPVLVLLRANLMGLIHQSSRSSSGARGVRTVSSLLVVGQVAFAIVLLTGAGLLIHSFVRATAINPGFDPKGVITGRIAIPLAHRASDAAAKTLQDRVVAALQEIPGVTSVALGQAVPYQGGIPVNALTLADETQTSDGPQPGANRVLVSADYAKTLKLTLLEGRFLEPGDYVPNSRAFVVDETFAQRYFPGRSALGGRFSFGGRPQNESGWSTVVGVVKNVPHRGVEDRSGNPCVYQPFGGRTQSLVVFLRTERPSADVITQMREKFKAIDPAIALFDTGELQGFIDRSFTQRRSVMILLGAFAGLALFLSALGIYGVLAYDVSQRTREIGVRGAIGAAPAQIVTLIMRQGLWKTAVGLVLGVAGALLLSRYMKTLLFDLSPTDPRAYAIVSVLLLVVAALASYLPARRAARINPIEALRTE